MQSILSRGARLLVAGALMSLSAAAAAQRPAVALGEGPWAYTTFEQGTEVEVSIVARDLSHPWSMAFLPGASGSGATMGDALITEKEGRIRLFKEGRLLPEPVADLSEGFDLDQLFDIALHPQFDSNGLVYFTYIKTAAPPSGSGYYATTALARGRFDGSRLTDIEDVFVANAWSALRGGDASSIHFAPDGHLLMTSSHRRQPEPPQDLQSHIGKVLRLTDDGQPAPGNPFADDPVALPEIYSYGHRTVMDITVHPDTSAVWELENGPHGGDEVNVISPGANYGWPIVTYGREYDGSAQQPWQDGMQPPELFWVPSITASSMLFYTGDRFPAWQGNLFVTAMSEGRVPRTGHLQRIVFNELGEVRRERLLTDLQQRIRHIHQGPDGLLYLLTDENDAAILRIAPAGAAGSARANSTAAAAAALTRPAGGSGTVLFAEQDCAACHQTERRSIGPSYVEIARRYAGEGDAVAQLAATIIDGSVGRWGEAPMTAHPGLGEDEARRMVQTILALAGQ